MTSSLKKGGPNTQILGVGDAIGAGDSRLVLDLLPKDISDTAFQRVRDEVQWKTMSHRGGEVPRLVAVEGEVGEDGSFPIYRHPADSSPPLKPFSPTVSIIREQVQKVLGHPVNHALIQLYRGGQDYISEHSDKTIDVVRGSSIVNVSLGAQRTMALRQKKDGISPDQDDENDTKRLTQKIPFPHNSMFIMGLETNAKWLHGIRQDKRPLTLKTPEETAFDGERISLTFRHIGTFLCEDESKIWGQGATQKDKANAQPVINGSETAAEEMIIAFGVENHQSDFNWDQHYGAGFDVLHFKHPTSEVVES
jgi:alkylated DNA repair dioxygenase AlkB